MIDLSLILVLLGFTLYGWHVGWRPMGVRTLALAAGYLAAFLLARPLGGLLAGSTGLPVLAAFVLGGLIPFFLVAGVVNTLGRAGAADRGVPSTESRIGGVALGALSGVALVVVLGWAVGALGSLTGTLPNAREGVVVRSSAEVVRVVMATAGQRFSGDPFIAGATASLISDPTGAMEAVRTVLAEERLGEALSTPGVVEAVRTGDPGPLARSPALSELVRDQAFMDAARTVGLARRGQAMSPEALAGHITGQLGPGLRTLEVLRNDATFQRMLDRAELEDAYAEGDLMALLSNPDFMELADHVVAELKRQQRR